MSLKQFRYRKQVDLELAYRIDKAIFALHRDTKDGTYPDVTMEELLRTALARSLPSEDDDKLPSREGLSSNNAPAHTYSSLILELVDTSEKPETSGANPETRYRALVNQLKFYVNYIRQKLSEQAWGERPDPVTFRAQSRSQFLNLDLPDTAIPSRSRPQPSARGRLIQEPEYEQLALRAANKDPAARLSDETLEFAGLDTGDYDAHHDWLLSHQDVDILGQSDELFVKAAEVLLNTNDDTQGRAYVHNASTYRRYYVFRSRPLQARSLAHLEQEDRAMFEDNVTKTFERLQRAVARVVEADGRGEDVEKEVHQIFVPEGTPVVINAPPPVVPGKPKTQVQSLYNQFSPALRRAVEAKSLDQINKVLSETVPSIAEQYVELLQRVSTVTSMLMIMCRS